VEQEVVFRADEPGWHKPARFILEFTKVWILLRQIRRQICIASVG
jgi:hypothetical protein